MRTPVISTIRMNPGIEVHGVVVFGQGKEWYKRIKVDTRPRNIWYRSQDPWIPRVPSMVVPSCKMFELKVHNIRTTPSIYKYV